MDSFGMMFCCDVMQTGQQGTGVQFRGLLLEGHQFKSPDQPGTRNDHVPHPLIDYC